MQLFMTVDLDVRNLSTNQLQELKSMVFAELECRKSVTLTEQEAIEVRSGRRIEAVKMVKRRLDSSLMRAKEIVDTWCDQNP